MHNELSVPSNCTSGDVQLVSGSSDGEGRVEVCYQGVWTTVDGSTWNYPDARVLCRQLGYNDKCEYSLMYIDTYITYLLKNCCLTTMQGLLLLIEMLEVAIKDWCTSTTVVEVKHHFSHVHKVHTQLIVQTFGIIMLELQLSASDIM